jgi:hypothetical protein
MVAMEVLSRLSFFGDFMSYYVSVVLFRDPKYWFVSMLLVPLVAVGPVAMAQNYLRNFQPTARDQLRFNHRVTSSKIAPIGAFATISSPNISKIASVNPNNPHNPNNPNSPNNLFNLREKHVQEVT